MTDLSVAAAIPADMIRIAVAGDRGGPDALRTVVAPTPVAGVGEIVVKVRAAGVNRPDILQRQGLYPPPPGAPDTLGLEVAGEVVAVDPDVRRWKVGDAVCALLIGGGYAQYVSLDARQAMPVPFGLSMVEAAALPETVLTVFSNVFERARLSEGETLLVHGATSGIGVMAVLMGKAAGARVVATGRGAEKADAARRLGADLAIDASADDWVGAVTSAGGADVVLDMVGAAYLAGNLSVLKPDGRLAAIAFLGGAKAEVDLSPILLKRLTITGSTLRSRPAAEKGRLASAAEARIWPWIAAGKVRAIVDRVFPLEEAGEAHRYLESGAAVGKVVLEVSS